MAAVYGEERVNYYTNDHQYGAQVALLADGSYVVSWVSRGQDGSDDGIYAQRYNSVGMPVGAEFRVNSATANAQIQPTIVGLSDGGFVVAWSDQYADGSSWGVFAQRYCGWSLFCSTGMEMPILCSLLLPRSSGAYMASMTAGRALKRPGRSARRRWLIWYWPMGREERKRRISSSPISL